MQQIAERLEIGLLARRRELDVKRNSGQGADPHVIRVGAAAAPHAGLGFGRRAILAGDGAHREAMLKPRARDAAGHEQLLEHPFLADGAALKLRGQHGFSGHAAVFEDARPHEFPGDLAGLGLLRHQGLPGLMAEQKFLLVPGLARHRRAQLLIEPVALSRDLADARVRY